MPFYQATSSGHSRAIISNRLSYFFDLRGPSATIDTACSASLVALHLACQSLRSGESEQASWEEPMWFSATKWQSAWPQCGEDPLLPYKKLNQLTLGSFLSPDGRCYSFDDRANGYSRGEGAACVLLKPLKDAIRDNDPIRAVIRNTGTNQDGRTAGITLPNGAAQESLIKAVYAAANIDPGLTSFVECHGTGTAAGDPIETEALANAFTAKRSPEDVLRIGSVKANVGDIICPCTPLLMPLNFQLIQAYQHIDWPSRGS